MVFEKYGERIQNFDLKLSVPHTYPAGETNVEIGGRWYNKPGITGGTIGSDNVILNMAPFEDGSIGTPTSLELKENEEKIVPIVVLNPGNVKEHYLIETEGDDILRNVGISFSLEEGGMVEVDAGNDGEVSAVLIGNEFSPDRTYHLTFKLMDLDSNIEYDRVIISIYTVKENEIPPIPNADDDEDGNDSNDIVPEEENEDGNNPVVNTSGNGMSGTLIGYILLVLVIGVAAIGGFIVYSKNKD